MIVIKQGKEKNLLKHHPWVFTGAIESAPENFCGVDRVVTSDGSFIAWGWYDEKSHIVLHLLEWNEDDKPCDEWFERKTRESVLRRKSFFVSDSDTNVFRIIHGEADMLPGIAADVYGRIIRVIVSSRIAYDIRNVVVSTLENLLHPQMIILNTDKSFCGLEQIKEVTEYYKGGVLFTPEKAFDEIIVRENGLLYSVLPGSGQKSGFFCDQRENRIRAEKYCKDAEVLDICSYTGSFTLHALRAGAKKVDAYDSSQDAVKRVLTNVHINVEHGILDPSCLDKVSATKADMFETLRSIRKDCYDVIILDPPKLAKTQKDLEDAKKAYKDLNRLAMEKVRNNGVIVTCSCSGALSREDFRTVLAWSAKDSHVEIQVLETLGQGCDHPIRLSFPESEYLKVFILRVIK